MRRIFVGDIQGCREQLSNLLAVVEFESGVDQLFPTGDLVNKGPDSDGVLRLLMDLDARPVLGNHDLLFLEKGAIADPACEEWLRAQPYARVLPDVILVHAGLHPKWTEADLANLSPEDIDFAITVRYCDGDGNRPDTDWPIPGDPYRPWHEFYHGTKRVVFGHWARQGLLHTDKLVGLDTGCVYGNPITAWIAEDDRIVQAPGWPGP